MSFRPARSAIPGERKADPLCELSQHEQMEAVHLRSQRQGKLQITRRPRERAMCAVSYDVQGNRHHERVVLQTHSNRMRVVSCARSPSETAASVIVEFCNGRIFNSHWSNYPVRCRLEMPAQFLLMDVTVRHVQTYAIQRHSVTCRASEFTSNSSEIQLQHTGYISSGARFALVVGYRTKQVCTGPNLSNLARWPNVGFDNARPGCCNRAALCVVVPVCGGLSATECWTITDFDSKQHS